MVVALPDDPEFRLAACCCRWPPSPARDEAVRVAARGVDWVRFGRVVRRQRVVGMADAALRCAHVAPPPDIADGLIQEARRIMRGNLLAAAETARLVARITAAGHPVVALKGVTLAMLAYGTLALKHSKDIDLLVPPASALAVIALLEDSGYRLVLPAAALAPRQRLTLTEYGKDVTLVDGRGNQVELHWRPFDSRALLCGVNAAAPAQDVALGSALSAPTLAMPALYAYLVQHGATDGWSRLKWLADLAALLAPLSDAAITDLHREATALGAGAASAQALLLIREVFGRPAPADLATALARSRRVRWLIAGAHRLMRPPDGTRETGDWRAGQMLALAMQPLLALNAAHWWQVARSVLYPPAAMYAGRVPVRLYRLYPVVRIPTWLWRSLRAVPSARSAAQPGLDAR